ncbi:hypothetical protein E2C01_068814 [Portunus trituberculatus]|uniref:Uncharacterized protein n=1 Tax=Portunus trituberculatus TaxID=210409 RepID=A0A5B7HX80_PORTR|nr:hypothetical protein [Portunus trituberculatus]
MEQTRAFSHARTPSTPLPRCSLRPTSPQRPAGTTGRSINPSGGAALGFGSSVRGVEGRR